MHHFTGKQMERKINIKDYDYNLPEERIAKFPLEDRDSSKLLIYKGHRISDTVFNKLPQELPPQTLLVFNNTKVIHARLIFHKPSGARIEIFCLEPHTPADYERTFAQKEKCRWYCMVGNLKKWKDGALSITFSHNDKTCTLTATIIGTHEKSQIIEFAWDDKTITFGQLLEILGKIPIPPYLNRESEESDNTRYQTVYSKFEGSVAAPTAGLHFTDRVLSELKEKGFLTEEITLHVGAGTFLPVKEENAALHLMHTEHFIVKLETLKNIAANINNIIAVGTTSVRTLESLPVLGYRILKSGTPDETTPIGQWEPYDIPGETDSKTLIEAIISFMEKEQIAQLHCATRIMIVPGYTFKIIKGLVTNFHQPQSTLILLVSALTGNAWKEIYRYALDNNFRFLSYGDSSLLLKD